MIVDSHTHILPDEFRTGRERILEADLTFRSMFTSPRARIASAEELVEEMDEAGVDVSVAAGFGWTDPATARLANDYALSAASDHRGKIIPFCSVNPLWGAEAVSELERCAAAGARGLGELHPDTQGILDADLASLAPVLDAARSLDLPVMVHSSEPVGHSYPGKGSTTPDLLMALVTAYPRNKFIFSHFGGGLVFYELMPEVREALANVYFDSAAFPLLYRSEVFPAGAASARADRILFGSDYPLISQAEALEGARGSGLTDEQQDEVLGVSAAALFGLWKR